VETKQDFICLYGSGDGMEATNMVLAAGLYKFTLKNSLTVGDVLRIKKQKAVN
jgi:hypothetical protein